MAEILDEVRALVQIPLAMDRLAVDVIFIFVRLPVDVDVDADAGDLTGWVVEAPTGGASVVIPVG